MPSEHDVDIDAVADAVVNRLDPGTVIDNKVVLSRRQALALASGTVGLGALVGTSDVASGQASGQVGTSSEPVDVEAYDLAVNNQLSSNVDAGGNDLSNVGSLSTEQIGSDRHYAGAFNGTDPDARLDNALSAASTGDAIYLENAPYDAARTISTSVAIEGTSGIDITNAITATWTINAAEVQINQITVEGGGSITFNTGFGQITDSTVKGGGVQVNADAVAITECRATDVIFGSGTINGVADALYEGSSVTDNGTNTVGEIA